MATTTQIRTSSKVRQRAFSLTKLLDWAASLVLGIGAMIMILPFLWMFSTSLRPSADSYKLPPAWLPADWRFENYVAVFSSSVPIVAFALNSIKVTFFVTLGQLITCSMAGFAFARLRFPGRNLLFILLLASLMVPGQVTIIPIFIIMRQLGLVDNHLALILPGLTSAFGVFLLRQFFLTLPQDLLDAAKIDGAGPWTSFIRIAMPLAGPSLSALTILTFNILSMPSPIKNRAYAKAVVACPSTSSGRTAAWYISFLCISFFARPGEKRYTQVRTPGSA